MEKRKKGWYWVKWENGVSGDIWLPSMWVPDHEFGARWSVAGYGADEEDIVEIGPYLPKPDE